MEQIKVELKNYSYNIHIGKNLDYVALILQNTDKKDFLIVTNETIAPLYLDRLQNSLKAAGKHVNSLILNDGEQYKTMDSYMAIMTRLLELSYGRDCVLIALGGGVIGDITGFAASCYQRGVAYIQIPTTLLAMVDSSVGGKTAINHPLGKNMIGSFYQPLCVLADIDVLKTLAVQELIAGLGEVVKYGLILDKDFYEYLKINIQKVFEYDETTLNYIIKRCCELKAYVVAADEKENSLRAILNFGHTFGHAVETHLGYGKMLHGQAVGLGMAIAVSLCKNRKLLSKQECDDIYQLLKQAKLPTDIPQSMSGSDFITHMHHDKKVKAGVIRYVLLEHIGTAFIAQDVSDDEVISLIDSLKSNS